MNTILRFGYTLAILCIVAYTQTGCTHYAHSVTPDAAAPDSSTPIEYQVIGTGDFTSGYLGRVVLADGKTYNTMTDDWHAEHPKVSATGFADVHGNRLWAVSDESLSTWNKSTLNP
jgi:hypothetical protein